MLGDRFIPDLSRRVVHVPVRFETDMPSTSTQAEEDRRLLASVADGRQDALARLYERRGAALFSLLNRMLGTSSEAEDVLQEAFVLIWRRASSYDPVKASPWTWMVMLTRGLALDRLRSRQRRSHHQAVYEQEVASLELEHVDHSTPAADREMCDRLSHALRHLTDAQREAIELAFYRGWTHDEIARSSGQPLGTVKSNIRRGMIALRKLLKDIYA